MASYYTRRPTLAVPAANVLQIGSDASRVAPLVSIRGSPG